MAIQTHTVMSEDAGTIPFQAIILCGPGSSFPTFTTNADQNPKALLPIANRPMVWYAIDFCRRMLITGKLETILRSWLLR